MRVALGQLNAGQDKDANRGQAVAAVVQAADQGAELVVLPEAAMCGFGNPDTDLAPSAERLDGPFVSALHQAASSQGIIVVAGMFEPNEDDDGRVFNTVVVVGPDGLLGSYRKLHLFDALGWKESERVAPGDPAVGGLVFSVGAFQVGILTCYDLRFPEMARILVDRGATAIAVPAAWVAGPGKVDQWRTLLAARAIENTAYVVAAGQPSPGFSGHSMVVDPSGVVLLELDERAGHPSSVGDLDSSRVDEVRCLLPVLHNRRFGVVPRTLGRPSLPGHR